MSVSNSTLRSRPIDSNDTVISMEIPSQETKQIQALAKKNFHIHYSEFNEIKNAKNLMIGPSDNNEKILKQQIIFLALLSQNSIDKCPLSKEQEEAFRKSMNTAHTAHSWLWNGLRGATGVISCTQSAGIGVTAGSMFCFEPSTAVALQLTVLGVSCVTSVAVNYISWAATGIYPDLSSQADDNRDRTAREAQTQYTAIAAKLIALYLENKQVHEIIEKIDTTLLRSKIENDLNGKGYANDIINPLEEAIKWIQTGNLPLNTELRNRIDICSLKYPLDT